MLMYNLIKYHDNYSMKSGSLWNYYRDEVNDDENKHENSFRINNNKTKTSKSIEHKTKIAKKTTHNASILDTEFVAPLKYLSNFWIYLDLSLINCVQKWIKEYMISEISRTSSLTGNPLVGEVRISTIIATFKVGGSVKIKISLLNSENPLKSCGQV